MGEGQGPVQLTFVSWNVQQVAAWIISLGYTAYESSFIGAAHPTIENDISGDVLVHADNELLKELGMFSVGQRLSLLKTIYNLKVIQSIPFQKGDYIPESIKKITKDAGSASSCSPENVCCR